MCMKVLMGAVIVLSMATVTACGKKPEVSDGKTIESVHEESEMANEPMTESEYEETAESADDENIEIPESAGQGFERVANQSDWNGTYYREDGEYITVYDTDEDYLFLSYPESSYEHMIDILQFTDAGKTQAVSAAQEITAVYTLSGDVLSVDSGTENIPFMQGDYYRKMDASCWKTEIETVSSFV